MAIEVFCRYPTGATNAAERRILRRAVEILEEKRHSAVVLCDFFCGAQQIDLLVATEITTLVLQVKSYRHAVKGSTNSASWVNPATGESLPNGYTQATNQMLSLKDMLRERSAVDPGFARAAILFEQGIPVGSSLPRSDFRVQVCGPESLEALLLTHTSERSSRVPWSMEQLRGYAVDERMARLSVETLTTSPSPRSIPLPTQAGFDRLRSVDDTGNVIDVPARAVVSAGGSPPFEHAVIKQPAARPSNLPQRKKHLQRYLSAIATGVVVCLWWVSSHWSRIEPGATITSNAPSKAPSSHHPAKPNVHRAHMANAPQKLPAPSSPVVPAVVTTPDLQTPMSKQNIAPLPPCPEGIDRIGCVPSSDTLARLSGR